jgi:hypothetical protein
LRERKYAYNNVCGNCVMILEITVFRIKKPVDSLPLKKDHILSQKY